MSRIRSKSTGTRTHALARRNQKVNLSLENCTHNPQTGNKKAIKPLVATVQPCSPLDSVVVAGKRRRPSQSQEKHHSRSCCFRGPLENATATGDDTVFGARRPGKIPDFSRPSSSSPPGRATGATKPSSTKPNPEQETIRHHRRQRRPPPSASSAPPASSRSPPTPEHRTSNNPRR